MLVNSEDFDLLRHPKADLHQKAADGQTCLHKAITYNTNNLKPVVFLIEKGLDINAVSENGMTPLMQSLDYNCNDVACFLIDQENVDLNAINAYGFAAIHYAARNEDVKTLCRLLAAKADAIVRNHQNETFFDLLSDFNKKLFRTFAKQ